MVQRAQELVVRLIGFHQGLLGGLAFSDVNDHAHYARRSTLQVAHHQASPKEPAHLAIAAYPAQDPRGKPGSQLRDTPGNVPKVQLPCRAVC